MGTPPAPPSPPSPEERLYRAEQEILRQGRWIKAQHEEILKLRARVRSLERLRRIMTKVWSVFCNDPVRYILVGIGIVAWLAGKVNFDQMMHMVGGNSGPG